jgi:LCP family protein required for cell wall assembly
VTTTETPIVPTPAPPRRRHPALTVFLVILVFAVLAVFAAIAGLWWAESQIERIPEAELTALETPVAGGPRNILLVGTDSRAEVPEDFEDTFSDVGGSRADTIMLVHFVPGEGAQLLSIPRDLRVEIDGYRTNRINASYSFGGAGLLVGTIQQNLGIPIHHYIEIGFGSFAELVDTLGGVTLEFPNAAKDSQSGFSVEPGTHRLNGEEALAYARSRHYRELRDGEWESVGGSDIGRTRRQQALLLAIFDEAASASTFDVANFARKFAGLIRADEGLSTSVILELGRAGLALDRTDIEMMTLPVRASSEGGRSYVVRREPAADLVVEAFISGDRFPEN